MAKIEEQLKNSTCYGVAYDDAVKECKMCEVRNECKKKCEGEDVKKPSRPVVDEVKSEDTSSANKTSKPAAKPAAKAATPKPAAKAATPKTNKPAANTADMPDFKAMTLEELGALADERKVDPKWRTYDNEGIQRMRVTMALKKTYTK